MILFYFTDCVPCTTIRYTVFTGVCLSTGRRRYPKVPTPRGQVLTGGGYPNVPTPWPRYLPPQPGPNGGKRCPKVPTPPPPTHHGPTPVDMTADVVLDTLRSVCLLCSRRRTFLYYIIFRYKPRRNNPSTITINQRMKILLPGFTMSNAFVNTVMDPDFLPWRDKRD